MQGSPERIYNFPSQYKDGLSAKLKLSFCQINSPVYWFKQAIAFLVVIISLSFSITKGGGLEAEAPSLFVMVYSLFLFYNIFLCIFAS